jgi:hypothetical protein
VARANIRNDFIYGSDFGPDLNFSTNFAEFPKIVKFVAIAALAAENVHIAIVDHC